MRKQWTTIFEMYPKHMNQSRGLSAIVELLFCNSDGQLL